MPGIVLGSYNTSLDDRQKFVELTFWTVSLLLPLYRLCVCV